MTSQITKISDTEIEKTTTEIRTERYSVEDLTSMKEKLVLRINEIDTLLAVLK